MKKQLFNTLIIFLVILVAFVFYRFLKTEDIFKTENKQAKKSFNVNKTLDKIASPQKGTTAKKMSLTHVEKENIPLSIVYGTPEEMEKHTEEIYETLEPDNYTESIEKADEAFAALDEHVYHVSKIMEEHQEISSSGQDFAEEEVSPSETYEMELPKINE